MEKKEMKKLNNLKRLKEMGVITNSSYEEFEDVVGRVIKPEIVDIEEGWQKYYKYIYVAVAICAVVVVVLILR